MSMTHHGSHRLIDRLLVASAIVLALSASACASSDEAPPTSESLIDRTPGLVQPDALHITPTDTARDRHLVHTAQELYTFWNTGDTTHLDVAVGPTFHDDTLPTGRPQGPAGPVAASSTFRAAIPDLTCRLADLYVTGDTFTARLVFSGHFTGTYNGVAGSGQPIRFNAIDIQHAGGESPIVEDWHIEDNLTFLQQAGLVKVSAAGAPGQ